MSTPAAALALDGGDPRAPDHGELTAIRAHDEQLEHNSSISFEEYVHYAALTRAEEKAAHQIFVEKAGPTTIKSVIKGRFSKGVSRNDLSPPGSHLGDEKNGLEVAPEHGLDVAPGHNTHVSTAEWNNASRALRTAGWGSVFFLITTDILGPFSVPWAFAQMGYGPGIALYTVFGVMAGYSGFQLWWIYLHLDSDRYPLRGYGDMFFRVWGSWARHAINILQSVQLLFTVAILILSNGQSISQLSKGKLCFVVCLLVFMLAGMLMGQIRTLQRFGWLANFSVWVNVLIIFITMGVAANSPPNFTTLEASFGPTFGPGPVKKFAGTPPDGFASGGSGFVGSLNGLNQAVYSYGGAMLFVAFLAEMRHPWDFWKGLLCAEIFIYFAYMFFGLFVYSYQGQFAYNPAMQGLSPYNWQSAGNAMNLITGLIAAVLYGNIGIKVLYTEVLMPFARAPRLNSSKGKIAWVGLVPVYWAIAFVVAAAVPQFGSVSGLVGAVCILSFTYTFPAILAFGYQIQKDAILPEETFDESTNTHHYVDHGFKRWVRGFKVKWWLNIFNFIYFLGSFTTSVLGVYSSVLGLIAAFGGASAATSFGCTPPV